MSNKNQISSTVQIASGGQQLKSFGEFLIQHEKKLTALIDLDEPNANNDKQTKSTKTTLSSTASSNDLCPNIVTIDSETLHEAFSLFQLVASDNRIINKVIVVFAHLCEEIRRIRCHADSLQLQFLHIDEQLGQAFSAESDTKNDSTSTSGHHIAIVHISEMLGFLCEIQHLLNQCSALGINVLEQFSALCADGRTLLNTSKSIHFQSVFGFFADILFILESFDQILKRSNTKQYWTSFVKSIETASAHSVQQSKLSELKCDALKNFLNELQQLFRNDLLKDYFEHIVNIRNRQSAYALGELSAHLLAFIRNEFLDIENNYETDLIDNGIQSRQIIKVNLMCALNQHLFGNVDAQMWKTLFDFNGKFCAIPLIENILWCPDAFIGRLVHATAATQKLITKQCNELIRIRQIYLNQRLSNLTKDTYSHCVQIATWSVKLLDNLKNSSNTIKLDEMLDRNSLLLEGINLMAKIRFSIKSMTVLHIHLNTTMTKVTLIQICKLIDYVQIIRSILEKHSTYILSTVQNVAQHLSYQILQIIHLAKKKFSTDSHHYDERSIDIVSALGIAEKCMFGSINQRRILVTRLALSIAEPMRIFSASQLDRISKLLTQLEQIIELSGQLRYDDKSSFMHWHQFMFPIYLKHLMDSDSDCIKLKYIVSASNNPPHFDGIKEDLQRNGNHFQQIVQYKLCADIENFLRLDTHANLSNGEPSPDVTNLSNNMCQLIRSKPLPYGDRYIQIGAHIEHYLSNMFYNLTTVALHDWRTYGEMKCLANLKLDLRTVDDHLPTQTLEQGLDVLEIMRNIHIFVSKYTYNLNNQVFIQSSSNNKHLDTISIRHIANSLRTHGTGIINTTINFTYQFLRKKFAQFSQFMYDELIKSRLAKDLKYFRDNRERLNQMYSYERAEDFCRGIRKLGLTPDGDSFLDLFRQLISHIGNTLGFVRMMRSGGIHYGSNSSIFLPSFNAEYSFQAAAQRMEFSATTIEAASNFEQQLKNLSKNSVEESNYFQLLITTFSSFFRDTRNIHLKHFYMIVPPLTINFVEYIIMAKDKIIRNKIKNISTFTDDGFTIGLIYILKLLDQMSDFNSLYWFKSVRQKYQTELAKLCEQERNMQTLDDEKLQQTISLTRKRINTYLEEFDLLYCNLCSAKNFF